MKKIGLLGGMSWESSKIYYELINTYVKRQLGGLNSANIIMYSINFHEIEMYMRTEQWDKVENILIEGCEALQKAGADFILICTNTMHKLLPSINSKIYL